MFTEPAKAALKVSEQFRHRQAMKLFCQIGNHEQTCASTSAAQRMNMPAK
jgi:hypothetical protein